MSNQEACGGYEPLLSAYLDDQLEPEEIWLVQAHLHACSVCTESLVRLMALARAFHALPQPMPAADPWEAIAFTLRREHLVQPRWRRHWRSWGIAAAAMLLGFWSYAALRPAPANAPLEAYWREHAIFSSQEEPAVSDGAPALDAIEASYQLQGGQP